MIYHSDYHYRGIPLYVYVYTHLGWVGVGLGLGGGGGLGAASFTMSIVYYMHTKMRGGGSR